MIDTEAKMMAAQCRHYAMCKIDYLGTGICRSGVERRFVSYYPQGRMDIYRGLAGGVLPVTEALLDIADTCTLCGICDMQCHFVTGLRPSRVMAALKDYVAVHRSKSKPILSSPGDDTLRRLQEIVGADWATNDPAILFTYADDPFPLAGPQMPRYVVLPGSPKETAAVVRLARDQEIPFAVRGNGGSVFGFVFSDGIVLDMNRMRRITVDPENWTATVEAGVTSFDLQMQVHGLGFRVNAAEPAATVCGNIVCTGIFSAWSNTYGTAADNFIDMEFVDRNGSFFRLNDKSSPNVLAFEHSVFPSPGICTRATVRLHPRTDDEEGVLIPFEDLDSAVLFARDLARRRIGIALAVLGAHYLANFMSPDKDLSEDLKTSIPDVLGVRFAVYVVADKYAREAIRSMAESVIDARLFRTLMLGLPRLADPELRGVLRGLEGQKAPYE
ncbi:MAG: FAD-binding oxidoreductase, partial [Syntrophobacteraceae bacterium]